MDNPILRHTHTADTESFLKRLNDQKYEEIIKQKGKFEDNLFPPNDNSMYSGKTEFYQTSGRQMPDWIDNVIIT